MVTHFAFQKSLLLQAPEKSARRLRKGQCASHYINISAPPSTFSPLHQTPKPNPTPPWVDTSQHDHPQHTKGPPASGCRSGLRRRATPCLSSIGRTLAMQ
ncbi:hypothetical protein P280DRAFT_545809 [Massarina eburnea CBS 473.64]|uniref:Uncharacterized protein n=1 Tax=Massarina eburnea CBS 473.64 TaxID=1395130 RepID=A0A6A6SDK3_9PLEO|nr:hypothetical protein P280DRAFT_545809 [Massarina eburnea CBS 473.64]